MNAAHGQRAELYEWSTLWGRAVAGSGGGIVFAPLGYSVTNTRAKAGGARVIGRPQKGSRDLGGQPCPQTLGAPGQARRRRPAERGLSSLKQVAPLL